MSYDPEVLLVSNNWLACPYANSDLDGCRHLSQCHPEVGFKTVGKLKEHIWRCHTPFQNCRDCKQRWTAEARKNLTETRANHAKACRRNRQAGRSYLEIMSDHQQEEFTKTRDTNDNTTKLREIYTAVGKQIPITFHVRPLAGHPGPAAMEQQRAVDQRQTTEPLDYSQAPKQQPPPYGPPSRINSGFRKGFHSTDLDPTIGPSRTTSFDVIKSSPGSFESIPSGAGNPDSGYGGSEGIIVDKGKFAHDETNGADGGGASSQGLLGLIEDPQAGERYFPEIEFDDEPVDSGELSIGYCDNCGGEVDGWCPCWEDGLNLPA